MQTGHGGGRRGVRLSNVQVQCVTAAHMLVRDAGRRMLDDLSSVLDVATERTWWQRVVAQRRAGRQS